MHSLHNHCYLPLLCNLSTLHFITMQIHGTVFYSSIDRALFICSAFQTTAIRHLLSSRNKYYGELSSRHGLLVWSQEVRLCKRRHNYVAENSRSNNIEIWASVLGQQCLSSYRCSRVHSTGYCWKDVILALHVSGRI